MTDSISVRISRIYSAVGSAEESDLQKLRGTVVETGKFRYVFTDFSGGLSDGELSNQAHILIHNIANLKDHLRKWMAEHGHDKKTIDSAIDNSRELQVMIDLSNNDKHGYPPRDKGCSKLTPQVVRIHRTMRLQTQPIAGSVIGLTFGSDGSPRAIGDGTAKAVVTGDVIDGNGAPIGDLYEMALNAVKHWESLLTVLGLFVLPTTDDGA